ncbi:MAG TPA: TetR/AcrR family transcriptional regulator [Acidimicrobiales bacterium]|nr:TetR/AcrR family transcriptional regulator [Acidimicrobiales bacterium]
MATTVVSDGTLLDLALDAFADGGYDGTSVRELCRRLGVSHNLVHERYGSKDKLWYAAIDHGFRRLAADLATAAIAIEGDELDRLRAILVRYVEVTAERPALIRIVNQEAARPGGRLDHVYEQYIRPAHEVADAVLRDLERSGRARRLSPAALHFLVGHGAGGIVSLPALASHFPGDHGSLTAQAREAVEIVLRGIVTDPP